MIRILLLASILTACTTVSDGPTIYLDVIDGPQLEAYREGAEAWTAIGFAVTFEDSGLPACAHDWYVTGETECQLAIYVVRYEGLREQHGSDALADRVSQSIAIDTRMVDEQALRIATAHEVGHLILNTERHTVGGVMGGSRWRLQAVDRQLACETISICR